MAASLKVWRPVKNQTPSIDAYLREEQSCQISSWSNLKQWSLRLFEKDRPNNNNNNNKMSSNMGYDLKILSQNSALNCASNLYISRDQLVKSHHAKNQK